uniref:Major facilitator superfamily (MFS) profile domain-containing protein n=1 Tax=Acrobeloides nanus TaxID=290746 RepID=A0A914C5C9_9BILA
WDIVCDRLVLKANIQSMYYVGQMLGSLVFGFLGDRIGRKKVFMIAILLQIISGLGMVVAPFWFLYALFRIGVGFTHPGIFVIANVIGVELVGPSKRKLASIVTGAFFALGQAILGVAAYFIRDYRILHLVIALPTFLFLSYWWLVPESARWLVFQRKYSKADVVLRRAAKVNKASIPENWWEHIETNTDTSSEEKIDKAVKKYNFLDLFKTPKIRKYSFAAFFCWPVVSMVYYGVSMNTNFLGGDIYSTFIIGALVEIPAILFVFVAIDRIGRKLLLAGGYTIAAICLLSNLLISKDAHYLIAMVQFVLTKAAIGCTYATLYAFTPELFPTVIRNIAMGCFSMMARIGAISASFIAMWLVKEYGKMAMILPFSSLSLCAALIAMIFLPETAGKQLHDTIEDVENMTDERVIESQETKPLKLNDSPPASPIPKA